MCGLKDDKALIFKGASDELREYVTRLESKNAAFRQALQKIADHGLQLPWSECARILRQALGSDSVEEQ